MYRLFPAFLAFFVVTVVARHGVSGGRSFRGFRDSGAGAEHAARARNVLESASSSFRS